MNNDNLSTSEKILTAATNLIAENGFKETTTKDIAALAGVSEMTLFRHFGSKRSILIEAMRNHSFEYPIENEIKAQLTWDLETDLLLIAKMQYQFNLNNEKALLIKFKERQNLIDFHIDIKESPTKLKEFLYDYFNKMYAQGKIIQTNNENLAIYFMSYNFGIFCDKLLSRNEGITTISKEDELCYGVKIFARGLRP